MLILTRRRVLRFGVPLVLAPGLSLSPNATRAQATATATARKRGRVRLETATTGGTIRALLVGIDSYKHPDVAPTLGGAIADARDLADVLARAEASDVTVLIDAQATRSAMKEAIRGIAERTRRKDRAGRVVYYIRSDHIGRPVFATNAAGAQVWTASYLPFGGVRTATGTPITLRFPPSRASCRCTAGQRDNGSRANPACTRTGCAITIQPREGISKPTRWGWSMGRVFMGM